MAQTRQAVDDYLSQRGGTRAIPLPWTWISGASPNYAAIRKTALSVTMIGLEACLYGTHSLRRTKATLI